MIVITKKDLVDEETLAVVKAEVQGLVEGSFLAKAKIYTVSSKTGEGLEELKAGLMDMIHSVRVEPGDGVFRLPVDRVFVLKGHGTVVTGTLISGKIRKETSAELLPSQKRIRIRSIHAHDKNVDEARSGERTALNLQGVEKEEIQRGDIVTPVELFHPTSLLDVKITLLKSSTALHHNALIRFHHLTNDVAARVTLLGTTVLQPGESGYAQLRLQKPVHALHGDRFILRKNSPFITIGGGTILDHFPVRRISAGNLESLERLQKLESASPEERLTIAIQQKASAGAGEAYLRAKMGMPVEQLMHLQPAQVIFLSKNPVLAIHRDFESELIEKLCAAVKSFHQQNPLQFGISKEELRSKFLKNRSPELIAAILQRAMDKNQLQIQKDLIAIFGRKIALDEKQEVLALRIEEYLQHSGLDTPGLEDLARQLKEPPEKTRGILYLLVRQQKAVKIAEDYFLHKQAWEGLKQKIRSLKSSRKTFSVPDFKAQFGISRKFAIPLLENLDREGITRRAGNERIIL
jgi:selenocysteine-specific elongation factor